MDTSTNALVQAVPAQPSLRGKHTITLLVTDRPSSANRKTNNYYYYCCCYTAEALMLIHIDLPAIGEHVVLVARAHLAKDRLPAAHSAQHIATLACS